MVFTDDRVLCVGSFLRFFEAVTFGKTEKVQTKIKKKPHLRHKNRK